MNTKTQREHPNQASQPQAVVSVIVDDVAWDGQQLEFVLRSVDIPAPTVAAARKLAEKIRATGLTSRNPDAGIVEQRIPPRSIRKITVLDIAAYQSWQAAQMEVEAKINAPLATRPEPMPAERGAAQCAETQNDLP